MSRARGTLVPAAERGLRADAGARPTRCATALEHDPRRRGRGRPPAVSERSTRSRRPGGSRACGPRWPGPLFLHRRLTVQSRGERRARWTGCSRPGMLVRRDGLRAGRAARPGLLRVLGRGRLAAARARRGLVGAVRAGARRSCTASSSRGDTGSQRRIVEFARNRDAYVRKHHGRRAALAVRALTAWAYALRALAALVLPGHSAAPLRVARLPFAVPRPGRGAARGRGANCNRDSGGAS